MGVHGEHSVLKIKAAKCFRKEGMINLVKVIETLKKKAPLSKIFYYK